MSLPTLESVFSSDQIDILQQWITNQTGMIIQSGMITMSAGEAIVSNTSISSNSVVVITPNFVTTGQCHVTINDGVGFTISSTEALDTGTFSYLIKMT